MTRLNQTEHVLRQELLARKLATEAQLDGKLTIPFMNTCHSKVNQYLSLVRPEDVDNAYNKPLRAAEGMRQIENHAATKFWKGLASSDSGVAADEALYAQVANDWCDSMPQYISIQHNTKQLGEELAKRNWLPTAEHLTAIFIDLAMRGTLILNIENVINLPDAPDEATGTVLQNWIRRFPAILEPVVRKSDSELETERVKNLSANEYAAEFLQKDELPPIIQRRIESDIREFCLNHPNYDPSEEGKEILLSWIREQKMHVCHDSLEASWAANQEKLHAANCIFDSGPSIPVRYNASTLVDHRKPNIPPVEREVTLEPSPQIKRVDMDKLLEAIA